MDSDVSPSAPGASTSPVPVERRIRAAQQLAGFDSLDDMADAIGRPGLSRKTLRRIASENDPRAAKDYELEWIAAACGVAIEFLDGTDDHTGQGHGLTEKLDRIEKALTERTRHDRDVDQLLEQQNNLLDRQTSILRRIEVLVEGLPTDEQTDELLRAARGEDPPDPRGTNAPAADETDIGSRREAEG